MRNEDNLIDKVQPLLETCPHCKKHKPFMHNDGVLNGEKRYFVECPICELRTITTTIDRVFDIFYKRNNKI